MVLNSTENEYITYLIDLLQIVGPVNAKKMFGGFGIFLEGLMFALVADNTLYFKVDTETEGAYKKKGMEKFVYYKKGRPFSLSYYRAPDEVYEDNGEMKSWGHNAYTVALRAAVKKGKEYFLSFMRSIKLLLVSSKE